MRTVLCSIVYHSCAQLLGHSYQQFLQVIYGLMVHVLHVFLAQPAELFLQAGQNTVCVPVYIWMLTRVAQIITAAHRNF